MSETSLWNEMRLLSVRNWIRIDIFVYSRTPGHYISWLFFVAEWFRFFKLALPARARLIINKKVAGEYKSDRRKGNLIFALAPIAKASCVQNAAVPKANASAARPHGCRKSAAVSPVRSRVTAALVYICVHALSTVNDTLV